MPFYTSLLTGSYLLCNLWYLYYSLKEIITVGTSHFLVRITLLKKELTHYTIIAFFKVRFLRGERFVSLLLQHLITASELIKNYAALKLSVDVDKDVSTYRISVCV